MEEIRTQRQFSVTVLEEGDTWADQGKDGHPSIYELDKATDLSCEEKTDDDDDSDGSDNSRL